MNWLANIAKTLGPRLIGGVVASAAAWITTKTKGAVVIDADTLTQVIAVTLITYAASHRAASTQVNPGDAAKGRVADGIKTASDDNNASNTVIIPEKN